jgi:hypothetical protein
MMVERAVTSCTVRWTILTTEGSLGDNGDLAETQELTEGHPQIQGNEDLRKIERVPEKAGREKRTIYLPWKQKWLG